MTTNEGPLQKLSDPKEERARSLKSESMRERSLKSERAPCRSPGPIQHVLGP